MSVAERKLNPYTLFFITHLSMLQYSIIFLVVALAAGVLGFTGIAGTAAWIAKVLFVVFLVLFVISLVTGKKPKL